MTPRVSIARVPDIPDAFWLRHDVRDAVVQRDIGRLFALVRTRTRRSQTTIGACVGLSQPDVSAIERGRRRVTSLAVLDRIAAGLGVPPHLLGSAQDPDTDNVRATRAGSPNGVPLTGGREPTTQEDDVRRRELLAPAHLTGVREFASHTGALV